MPVARAGQYAIQTLLCLAEIGEGTVAEIADHTGVAAASLYQLITRLRAAGLVKTKRGPGGGLVLARPLEEVTLLSVLEAVGIHAEVIDNEWMRVLADPHRSRLESIERLLPDELALLTLADVLPLANPFPFDNAATMAADLLPPRSLLDAIGHQAVAATSADRCAVYFGGDERGYVTTAIEIRRDVAVTLPQSKENLTSRWVPFRPVGAVAVAWATGHPVIISDTNSDPRASQEIASHFQIRSVIAVPIHAGQNGSGVLVLAKQEANAWTAADTDRARELATIAGLAIVGHNHVASRTDAAESQTVQGILPDAPAARGDEASSP